MEFPEKYATGTYVAKEKVRYLDSIKNKFNQVQLEGFTLAYKKYIAETLKKKETVSTNKIDYSEMLFEALNSSRSVKIRYKGSWRIIDPYSVNHSYVVAYCHLARDLRTFRLDRIQDAVISEEFVIDKALYSKAVPRLSQAPFYQYNRRRF